MDERKREKERRKNDDFESKVGYVVARLRSGELSEKEVRLASQLGNPIAQAIIKQPVLRSLPTIFKQIDPKILTKWGVEVIKAFLDQAYTRNVLDLSPHISEAVRLLENASNGMFLTRIEDIQVIFETIRLSANEVGRRAERQPAGNTATRLWRIFYGLRGLEEFWSAVQMDRPNVFGYFGTLMLHYGSEDFRAAEHKARLGGYLLGIQ